MALKLFYLPAPLSQGLTRKAQDIRSEILKDFRFLLAFLEDQSRCILDAARLTAPTQTNKTPKAWIAAVTKGLGEVHGKYEESLHPPENIPTQDLPYSPELLSVERDRIKNWHIPAPDDDTLTIEAIVVEHMHLVSIISQLECIIKSLENNYRFELFYFSILVDSILVAKIPLQSQEVVKHLTFALGRLETQLTLLNRLMEGVDGNADAWRTEETISNFLEHLKILRTCWITEVDLIKNPSVPDNRLSVDGAQLESDYLGKWTIPDFTPDLLDGGLILREKAGLEGRRECVQRMLEAHIGKLPARSIPQRVYSRDA